MIRLLLASLAALGALDAAEQTRDPFAPAAAPPPVAPVAAAAPAAPPAGEPLPVMTLEGVARSGEDALAILRVGTRRILVAKGKEFPCGPLTMRLTWVGDGEVLVRDQHDAEYALGIAIQPAAPPQP